MTSQPAEHCGAILPGIWEQPPTECVLRPGHQGSHANHEGARWIETPETDDDLEVARQRAVRIQTLLDDTRDRIRKLHQPARDWSWTTFGCGHGGTHAQACAHCRTCYPCPTITALEPPKEQP